MNLAPRLVAFFATGDSIVSNNLVLNLYKHINSPEARLFLSRQLYEEVATNRSSNARAGSGPTGLVRRSTRRGERIARRGALGRLLARLAVFRVLQGAGEGFFVR